MLVNILSAHHVLYCTVLYSSSKDPGVGGEEGVGAERKKERRRKG